MNQTQNAGARRFFLYRILSLAVVAVAILLRTLNLLLFYEKDIGYYAHGSITPVVLEALIFLSVIFFALYSFVGLRAEPPSFSPRTKMTSLAALVTAAALAIFTVTGFSAASAPTAVISPFGTALSVVGAVAMLYCLLFGLGKATSISALITGLGVILWCGIVMMEAYFDVTVQMNASAKLALHLGCIGGMLLMLGELRLVCGYPKKRFYAFAVSTATLFLGTASIPSIIADAFSRLPQRANALSDLVFLGLFLLGLARLTVPGEEPPAKDPETAAPEESDEPQEEPSQNKETT